MKKHFVTVRSAFWHSFVIASSSTQVSASALSVWLIRQSVLSLAKTDCRKNSQKILLSKEKESSCSRTSGAIRSWYQMQSWFGWTRWAVSGGKKAKESAGRKNESPPTQQDSVPLLYNQAQKRYDCGGFCSRRILDDRYLMVGRK